MRNVKWNSVKDKLPNQLEEPHRQSLWLLTKNYGTFSGMYHNGKFMKDYACELLDVTHWIELPDGNSLTE